LFVLHVIAAVFLPHPTKVAE